MIQRGLLLFIALLAPPSAGGLRLGRPGATPGPSWIAKAARALAPASLALSSLIMPLAPLPVPSAPGRPDAAVARAAELTPRYVGGALGRSSSVVCVYGRKQMR
jgi:hypothetical protein